MSHIPAMISEHSVTFYVDGTPYSAHDSNPSYEDLLEELKQTDPDVDRLIALTQPATKIRDSVNEAVEGDYLAPGVLSVTLSDVSYNGEPMHGVLVDRILWMLSEGFNIMPMVRFAEKLQMNPSPDAREELYLWLETSTLPITEDGDFLAFKNVRSDYLSHHDGATDNTPGTIVTMPRHRVDPDREQTCSNGLHFCSKGYLSFYSGNVNNKVVMLKINPADVVAIPSDYANAKGRAWKYEVLTEVDDPNAEMWAMSVYTDPDDEERDEDPDDDNDTYDEEVDETDDLTADEAMPEDHPAWPIHGPDSFAESNVGQILIDMADDDGLGDVNPVGDEPVLPVDDDGTASFPGGWTSRWFGNKAGK